MLKEPQMPARVAAGVKRVVLHGSRRGGLAQTGGSSMQKKADTAKQQLLPVVTG